MFVFLYVEKLLIKLLLHVVSYSWLPIGHNLPVGDFKTENGLIGHLASGVIEFKISFVFLNL